MTHPPGEPPQDAPLGQPWPAGPQPPSGPSFRPDAGAHPPGPNPTSDAAANPGTVREQHGATPPGSSHAATLLAPTGPNWGLAAVGVLLVLAAGAALAYLLGYRPDAQVRFGPQVLIALGAALVVVGAVGSLARHRRSGGPRRPRSPGQR